MRGYTRVSSLSNIRLYYNLLLIFSIPSIFILSLFVKKVRRLLLFRFIKRSEFEGDCILIHASSLGEAKQAETLVDILREFTDLPVLLSTFTVSGYEFGKQSTTFDGVITTPYDLRFFIDMKLKSIKPQLAIFIEGDLWTNLLFYLKERDIPLLLVSGRMSDESFHRLKLIRGPLSTILSNFDGIYPVSESVKDRYVYFYIGENELKTLGSLKYKSVISGVDIDVLRDELSLNDGGRVLVWGSFHRSEIDILCEVLKRVHSGFPDVVSIVAPRYISDAEQFANCIGELGFEVGFRSKQARDWQVLILDTLGELSTIYSTGTIAIVGGTFTTRGGQNIVEPALLGIPVVFGSDVRNFSEEAELLRGDGGFMVEDGDELYETIENLLNSNRLRRRTGEKAYKASSELVFKDEEFSRELKKWI